MQEKVLQQEEWALYDESKVYQKFISNLGRTKMFNKARQKWTQPKDTFGISAQYYMTRIGKKMTQIHRLVAEHFVPNPGNLPVVNHKDLNKLNNRADNLEWTTYEENMMHAWSIIKYANEPYAVYQGKEYYVRKDLAEIIDVTPQALSWMKKKAKANNGYNKKNDIQFVYNRKEHKKRVKK